jgi:5-methyltetrahydropteroyltriglutamate--homocysteine methyltransferase
MAVTHTLGSPRIGRDRELKCAQEAFRQGSLDEAGLRAMGQAVRAAHWQAQSEAGIDLLPVGDFAWHDQVLTHSLTFGVIPQYVRPQGDGAATLHTLFAMAHGGSVDPVDAKGAPVGETASWFDTDHVYQVPVFSADQAFQLSWTQLFEEVDEAQALGYRVKPVILGPLTYLWLGKAQDEAFDRLDLVERLLPLYDQIFHRLADQGVEWVQIDEPILALDLPQAWKNAYERVYNLLQRAPLKKLITTYFGGLQDNLGLAANLPVDGLHIDLVCAPEQYPTLLDRLPTYKTLSLGLVDGRNLEGCDVDKAMGVLRHAAERLGDRLWVAPSCSLLQGSNDEPKRWLAFAVQKCQEVALLAKAVNDPESAATAQGVAYGLAKAS